MNNFHTNLKPLIYLLTFFGQYPYSDKTWIRIILYIYSFSLPNLCFCLLLYEKINNGLNKWEIVIFSGHGIQTLVKTFISVTQFNSTLELIRKLNKLNRKEKKWKIWFFIVLIDYAVIYTMNMILTGIYTFHMFKKCIIVSFLHTWPHREWVLYSILCLEIIKRSKNLKYKNNLETMRIENMKIISCVDGINKAFGLKILFSIIFYGLDTFVNLYISIYHQNEFFLSAIWFSLIDFTPLYIISVLSPTVIKYVRSMREKLLRTSTINKSYSFCNQIDLYLDQINCSTSSITAWAIFPINLVLFGHFANTLLTFFIAMAQFSDDIEDMIKKYKMNSVKIIK